MKQASQLSPLTVLCFASRAHRTDLSVAEPEDAVQEHLIHSKPFVNIQFTGPDQDSSDVKLAKSCVLILACCHHL